jgi:3-hydroxy acid dehydrogenase/malonic semialdehyde reductase
MSGVERPPDVPLEVIQDVYATNVTGVINMTQAILPIFKSRSDGGKGDIIMIGSIAGREPYVGGTVSCFRECLFSLKVQLLMRPSLNKIYCSSKAAIRAFTDALRRELIDTRIRVMTVDPGQVLTVGISDCPYTFLILTRTCRSLRQSATEETKQKLTLYMRMLLTKEDMNEELILSRGCEPLTPDDVAEVIVFAAGRRENVVVADTLLFPSHQASMDLPRTMDNC